MWVAVDGGWRAMCCPARVSNPHMALEHTAGVDVGRRQRLGHQLLKLGNLANLFYHQRRGAAVVAVLLKNEAVRVVRIAELQQRVRIH
eukprot:363291-Chlamydomonas_euryale.AAC.17